MICIAFGFVDNQEPVLNCPNSRTFYAGRGKAYADINYEWEPVQVCI